MKRIRISKCCCGRPACEAFFLHNGDGDELEFIPTDVAELLEALEAFRGNGYEVGEL